VDIKKQEILSIQHYFQLKPVSCIVVSGDIDSFFTAKTLEPIKIGSRIIKGDPIIIGALQNNNEVEVTGGRVIAVNDAEGHIIVSPDKIYDSEDRRKFERYPVSLSGNITCHKSGGKREDAYIKDMSHAGFCVYSKADLHSGDNVEVDIYLHNNVFNICGTIMRKSVSYGRYEYGIQTVYKDKSSMYSIRDFLDKLLINDKEVIKKHLLKDFRIGTL